MTRGFASPTYTQIPNDFFVMLRGFTPAEAFVLLILMRETFGYHSDLTEMSVRELAKQTGMSQSTVLRSCKSLEQRELIERLPDGNHTLIWRVIVDEDSEFHKRLKRASMVEARASTIEAARLYGRGASASTIEALSAVKERNKRNAEPALGSGSAGEEEAHVPAPKPPKFARAGLI